MPYKINIAQKEKTWKIESSSEAFVGKKIGESISGKEIAPELEGYEFEITGASDLSGFPHKGDVEGPELKRLLLTKGWGMHKKPRREGKKKVQTPDGLRLRKTVRGKQLSEKTSQINLKISKEGSKPLKELFPEQNKPKQTETPEATQEAAQEPQAPEAPAQAEAPTAQ